MLTKITRSVTSARSHKNLRTGYHVAIAWRGSKSIRSLLLIRTASKMTLKSWEHKVTWAQLVFTSSGDGFAPLVAVQLAKQHTPGPSTRVKEPSTMRQWISSSLPKRITSSDHTYSVLITFIVYL